MRRSAGRMNEAFILVRVEAAPIGGINLEGVVSDNDDDGAD